MKKDKLYYALHLLKEEHNDLFEDDTDVIFEDTFYAEKDWMFALLKWWKNFECSYKGKCKINNIEVNEINGAFLIKIS